MKKKDQMQSIDNEIVIDVLNDRELFGKAIDQGKIVIGQAINIRDRPASSDSAPTPYLGVELRQTELISK